MGCTEWVACRARPQPRSSVSHRCPSAQPDGWVLPADIILHSAEKRLDAAPRQALAIDQPRIPASSDAGGPSAHHGAQRRIRSPMPCADGELWHWEWPSGWPDRNHRTSEQVVSVRLSRTGSSWDGNRGCGGTVRNVEQQLKDRHGPAELPENGWAFDPDCGEPGAAGARRPDSAGPVRQGKGAPTTSQPVCVQVRPPESREKSSSPRRADSGASGVAPNNRPAARWQSSSGVAASGTLRPRTPLQEATVAECTATPCGDASFPVSHASSTRTSSRFLASRPQATPIRWTGSAPPLYLSA